MVTLFLYSSLAQAGDLTPRGSHAADLGGNYMRDRAKFNARAFFLKAAIVAGMSFVVWFAGCSSPKPAQQGLQQGPRRFSLNGRGVSVDKAKRQLVLDHGEITGFMIAMAMCYSAKNPT